MQFNASQSQILADTQEWQESYSEIKKVGFGVINLPLNGKEQSQFYKACHKPGPPFTIYRPDLAVRSLYQSFGIKGPVCEQYFGVLTRQMHRAINQNSYHPGTTRNQNYWEPFLPNNWKQGCQNVQTVTGNVHHRLVLLCSTRQPWLMKSQRQLGLEKG